MDLRSDASILCPRCDKGTKPWYHGKSFETDEDLLIHIHDYRPNNSIRDQFSTHIMWKHDVLTRKYMVQLQGISSACHGVCWDCKKQLSVGGAFPDTKSAGKR